MRRVRIVLGILILILSITLLIWGFVPARHEIRRQPVSPTDLQLPTPISLRADKVWSPRASLSPWTPDF